MAGCYLQQVHLQEKLPSAAAFGSRTDKQEHICCLAAFRTVGKEIS